MSTNLTDKEVKSLAITQKLLEMPIEELKAKIIEAKKDPSYSEEIIEVMELAVYLREEKRP